MLRIKLEWLGKVFCDIHGCKALTKSLSQRDLKKLKIRLERQGIDAIEEHTKSDKKNPSFRSDNASREGESEHNRQAD